MGHSTELFVRQEIDQDLVCVICQGVLDNPIMLPQCEHLFCKNCIENWVKNSRTCPIDRTSISDTSTLKVPRPIRNLLDNLELKCTLQECNIIVKLGNLKTHVANCPSLASKCEYGCGTRSTQEEMSTHNCSDYLFLQIQSRDQKIQGLESINQSQKEEIGRMMSTIAKKHDEIKSLMLANQNQHQELENFKASLNRKTKANSLNVASVPTMSFSRAFMDIAMNDEPFGRIVFELRTDVVPKTCEHFRVLCTGEKGFGYKGSSISRVKSACILGGHDASRNGIDSRFVQPENYNLKHDEPGIVSMTKSFGRAGPEFCVTTDKADYLDGSYVVFGSVVHGLDLVKRIISTEGGFLGFVTSNLIITNCGEWTID